MNFVQALNLIASGGGGLQGIAKTTFDEFKEVIDIVLPTALLIVVAFGLVYGIVLGVQFAKAEDAEQRDKAKGRLINMIIGVLVALVIISVVYAILNANFVQDWFTDAQGKK